MSSMQHTASGFVARGLDQMPAPISNLLDMPARSDDYAQEHPMDPAKPDKSREAQVSLSRSAQDAILHAAPVAQARPIPCSGVVTALEDTQKV